MAVVVARRRGRGDGGHWPCGSRHIETAAHIVSLIDANPEREVVLYCSVGERSSRLAREVLERRPRAKVFDIEGGIFAWAITGGAMVTPNGAPTRLVHPYDDARGRLLLADRRAPTDAL